MVRGLRFTHENLEQNYISASFIGMLSIEGISKTIRRVACNGFMDYERADLVVVELFAPTLEDVKSAPDPEREKVRLEEALKRIEIWKDLTAIDVCYADGKEEELYIPYMEASDEIGAENVWQKTYRSKCGHLYLVIGKDKDIEDFFDKTRIDDQEQTTFHRNMLREK